MLTKTFRAISSLLAAALLLGTAMPAFSALAQQEDADASITVPVFERTALRTGPGDTYAQIDSLPAGASVTLLERNRAGTWLHVIAPGAGEGGADLNGWLLSGYLTLENVRFSQVPVNDSIADADLSAVSSPDLASLYAVPVVPTINSAMREVFARGLEAGNNPNVIAKIGDCNTATGLFLAPIASGAYDLGPYDHFQDSIDFFAESFANNSEAARIGFNAIAVFDPLWANRDRCLANESPLSCEFRRINPSVAVIMFGQNDMRVLNSEQYDQYIRQIVDTALMQNIIPVLTTFTSDQADEELFPRSLRYNLIMVAIAREYGVPLINFWSAARILPRYGIGEDNAHLTASGTRVNFATGHEARYGASLHNLLVLQALDEIYNAIIADARG